jgi:hypothetical protein
VTLLFSLSQSHHKDTTQFTRWVCLTAARLDEYLGSIKMAQRSGEEYTIVTLYHCTTEDIARLIVWMAFVTARGATGQNICTVAFGDTPGGSSHSNEELARRPN